MRPVHARGAEHQVGKRHVEQRLHGVAGPGGRSNGIHPASINQRPADPKPGPNSQKFFGSFFQKRTASFLSRGSTANSVSDSKSTQSP